MPFLLKLPHLFCLLEAAEIKTLLNIPSGRQHVMMEVSVFSFDGGHDMLRISPSNSIFNKVIQNFRIRICYIELIFCI